MLRNAVTELSNTVPDELDPWVISAQCAGVPSARDNCQIQSAGMKTPKIDDCGGDSRLRRNARGAREGVRDPTVRVSR